MKWEKDRHYSQISNQNIFQLGSKQHLQQESYIQKSHDKNLINDKKIITSRPHIEIWLSFDSGLLRSRYLYPKIMWDCIGELWGYSLSEYSLRLCWRSYSLSIIVNLSIWWCPVVYKSPTLYFLSMINKSIKLSSRHSYYSTQQWTTCLKRLNRH